MITEREAAIFEKYGDYDTYYYNNRGNIDKNVEHIDWMGINVMVGDLILIKSGKASDDLRKKLMENIRQNTESDAVILNLERIADKLMKK